MKNAFIAASNEQNRKNKRQNKRDDTSTSSSDNDDINVPEDDVSSKKSTWWSKVVNDHQYYTSTDASNKLLITFEILKECKRLGDKCLIFSAFTSVLDLLEILLQKQRQYEKELDYYRLDGKTSKTDRHKFIEKFNSPTNKRGYIFLISAKAGGIGINLTGANRVILLDTAWNPSNDGKLYKRNLTKLHLIS